MASPGVVFSLRFVQAKDAKDNYSRYAVGYLSRPQAFDDGKLHDDDPLYHDSNPKYDQYGYMSNKDKTDGLFDANEDFVSDYHKYRYTETFDSAQKKCCPLYQGVISFDNAFLSRNDIDYKSADGLAKLKEIARPAIATLIHESKLDETNIIWTAAIHQNTDNIHIHIAIVEREKVNRRYDKLEEKAFEKLKSRVGNAIVGEKRINELKTLSQSLQCDIPKWVGAAVQSSEKEIKTLLNQLPDNIPWEYNRKGMEPYHQLIDDCVRNIVVSHEDISKQFESGMNAMSRCESLYEEIYGTGEKSRAKRWAENKLRDFYSRAGNALLKQAKNCRELDRGHLPPVPSVVPAPLAGEKSETSFDRVIPFESLKKSQSGKDSLPEIPKQPVIGTLARPAGDKRKKGLSEINTFDNQIPADTEPYESPKDSQSSSPENWRIDHYFDPLDISYLSADIDSNIKTADSKKLAVSAEKGDAFAQYKLGRMYLTGKNVPKDSEIAIRLMTASAAKENPYAMYALGRIYSMSGVQPNEFLSSKYFYEAFKRFNSLNDEKLQKDERILLRLGCMAFNGEGTWIDFSAAEEYWLQATKIGNAEAAYRLGMMHLLKPDKVQADSGKFKADPAKAAEYLRMAIGNSIDNKQYKLYLKSSFELATLYRKGIGVEKNDKEVKLILSLASYWDRQMHNLKSGEYFAEWSEEYKKARNYLYGSGEIKRDFELALDFMTEQANAGNAFAIFDLARMTANGLGMKADADAAKPLYEKALDGFLFVEKHTPEPEAGKKYNAKAYFQYRIGKMYAAGLGIEQNYTQAAKWFQQSADRNNKFAQYSLAGLYYRGNGVEKDAQKAFALYCRSAAQGNAFASYEAGRMCAAGIGTKVDGKMAEDFFGDAYRAFVKLEKETKDDKIQFRLGRMLATGTGVVKDENAAAEYYKKSAELGNANAQYALGCLYLDSKTIPKNVNKAVQLLSKSALSENDFAQYKLGCLLFDGKDMDTDTENALQLFSWSAELGNQFAEYKLGGLYLNGETVNKDVNKAVQLLTASAAQDNQFAEYSLGRLYLIGEDIEKNVPKAIGYMEASAAQHNQFSQYALGRLYLLGDGIEKNVPKGMEYLKASAAQGNQFAQYALGHQCLHDGKKTKALEYFRLSAAQGNEYAKDAITRINNAAAGRKKYAFHSMNAAISVNRAVKQFAGEYERRVARLEREYDYEQDYEIAKSQARSL